MHRIGIFATHPIQYQVPLWRALSAEPDLDIQVYYFSDQGLSGARDPGFGLPVVWDVPLLQGYRHHFLTRLPIGKASRAAIPRPQRLLDRERFDAILLHGYTHRFARQLIRLRRRFGYRVVLRGEFTDMPRRPTGMRSLARTAYLNWFYRQVDHFCPVGTDAIAHLKHRGIGNERMTLAPYSIDDALVHDSMRRYQRSTSRQQLGIADNHLVILFSGKMIARKQPLLLAQALKKLDALGHRDFSAIFLGNGELHARLLAELAAPLGNRLIAPGFVNQAELGRYFTAADLLVLPSTYDTWGLVVNEAMHYGLPCIVSDRVGCRADLISDGETGYIFAHDDCNALVRLLADIAARPEVLQRLGQGARQRILSHDLQSTVNGLITALRGNDRPCAA